MPTSPAALLLAFDDTDDLDGGCTTHMLLEVLASLEGLAPRGMPRLVRLNPNVPWKTRGNGAVAMELVGMEGPHTRIGEWRGHEVRAYPDGPHAPPHAAALERVWQVVSASSRHDASPAVCLFDEAPPAAAYWQAVQGIVRPDEARDAIEAAGGLSRATGDGRGLVGCLGAAAWPGPPASYEFLAYRETGRWGSRRAVDATILGALDNTGVTFHSWDDEEEVAACVPNTPCPVLAGLRGRDPERLRDGAVHALARAAGEPVDAWILWASNQASGDHVTPVPTLLEAPPYATVEVDAVVARTPVDREGGHLFVAMDDPFGVAFDAAAFEPTKRFRDVVRRLRPGDEVTVVGAWRDGTVRLEKLQVRSAAPRKVANPEHCGKAMKSRGAGAGYKCSVCGATAAADAATTKDAGLHGWYEVPVTARRHLHRPLAWDDAPDITGRKER